MYSPKNGYKWLIGGIAVLIAIVAISVSSGHTSPSYTSPTPTTATAPQTPPPSAVFHTVLAYGSSGTAVASLQQFLNDEGYYSGADNSIFDQATINAVISFQHQENISPANGVFGSVEEADANTIMAAHPDWVTYLSNNNGYSNVNGSPVHSPSYSTNGIPAGASAVCGDGTYSFSMHHSGTCSHHGGVSQWLN